MSALNPANSGTWNPEKVPPRDDGSSRSRYAVGRVPEGWPANSTGQAVNRALERVLERRKSEAPELTPGRVELPLKYVQLIDGEYALLGRGTISGSPVYANTRPSKFKKLNAAGGALIDELFLNNEAPIRDDQAWTAAREHAERENLTGFELRSFNDLLCVLLALRAGLSIQSAELPPPPTQTNAETDER